MNQIKMKAILVFFQLIQTDAYCILLVAHLTTVGASQHFHDTCLALCGVLCDLPACDAIIRAVLPSLSW